LTFDNGTVVDDGDIIVADLDGDNKVFFRRKEDEGPKKKEKHLVKN